VYLSILPFDAERPVSSAVGNIIPFIETLPCDENKFIAPPDKEGLTMFKETLEPVAYDSI
jgi:hypothetical protein